MAPLGARPWRIILFNGVCHVGTGLTLPYLLVYLHSSRTIGVTTVGLILATIGFAGLLCTPLTGSLADRYGAGPVLVASLLTGAIGTGCFAVASAPDVAFLCAAIFGAGVASMWSALTTLLARAVSQNQYIRVFGFNNAAANVGMGIGAGLGSVFLRGSAPRPYQLMFYFDAASFVLFAAVMVLSGEVTRYRRPSVASRDAVVDDGTKSGVWRAMASDRRLVMVTALNTVLIIAIFSQLTTVFPAWVVGPARSSVRIIGVAFALNTFLVAVLQPIVIARVERMVRTTAASLASMLFACCWLIVLVAPIGHGGLVTSLILVTALVVAAFGEILLAPSLSALVNGIAADDQRGRYNAFFNIAWQIGPIIGPAVAGLFIGHGMAAGFLVIIAGICVAAAGWAALLRRIFPAGVNGIYAKTSGNK